MAEFEVLKSVEVEGDIVTFFTSLPPRELGATQEQIQNVFWSQLDFWVAEYSSKVQGREVRFSGPAMAAMLGTAAGALFYELRAREVKIEDPSRRDPERPEVKHWTRVLDKRRRPWSIRPGQVVNAVVFGQSVSDLVVKAASMGDQFQLVGKDNRTQVWASREHIAGFVRWLSAVEERAFSAQPRYHRPFNDLGVKGGDKVRFVVFGIEAVGRVTATRNTSVNIVEVGDGDGRQTAVLVPLDDVREIL